MKLEMFEFVLKSQGIDLGMDFNPFVPYVQYPAPSTKRLTAHERRFPNYARHPELSRAPMANTMAIFYHNSAFFGGVAATAIPAYSILLTSAVIPETATATRQSGVTGQPTIGSAGTELIYGEQPSSIWDVFTVKFWRGY